MNETSKSIYTTLTPDSFWESISILVTKPHVINRRLWGNKIWFKYCYKSKLPTYEMPPTIGRINDLVTSENIDQHKTYILNELNINYQASDATSNIEGTTEVLLMELLPKNYTNNQAFQLVCLQKDKCLVTFYDVTPENQKQNLCPNFSYKIELNNSHIVLNARNDAYSKSHNWLVNTLLPQLIKWGLESTNHNIKSKICSESLSLVSQTKYYEKYNDLKLKYGKEMVKIWPECTDASKFVYEDVAIATYLLLLWEQDGTNIKKFFVDLGCGNGLLVYILTMEGHIGLGIDVRKRNIWDMYPSNVILKEKTITPSDISIFPDMDWIIGNHSDELTPWIPVITAKSSYKCNFFLLPCCAFRFDGSKYQRQNSYKSQYNDYLDYITQLCVACGFNINTDRLKIPSTKRICIVSNGRIYSENEYEEYCNEIDGIIRNNTSNTSEDNNMESDFKARTSVEKVRNCTQIDKNVIDLIVDCISKYLMEGCSESESGWSIGRTAELNELVQLIPKEQLSILKSECGGIQTLLKNNHNIFEVKSGKVGLRYPKKINEVGSTAKKRKMKQKTIKVQQKPCWFYNNHPQGCPLSDTDCSFLHVKLKQKNM